MKFKELDTITSIVKINNVPPNTKGTIVFDYGNNYIYEVEFFENNKTISVETVSKEKIRRR